MVNNTVIFLAIATNVLQLIAIVVLGVWLFRRTRLRAVPWLMTYLLVPQLLGIVMPLLMRSDDFRESLATNVVWLSQRIDGTIGSVLVIGLYLKYTFIALASTLALWMLCAGVVAKMDVSSDETSLQTRGVRLLAWPHRHVALCGVVLLALVLLRPLTVLLLGSVSLGHPGA